MRPAWPSHVDRMAPRRRPTGPVVGRQEWLDLLYVHWRVEAELLRPLVPSWLTLDLHDGETWVTLIPFRIRSARPALVPRVAGLDLLETNLRTYVHVAGRPGIYFFSLEASSTLAVMGARVLTGLPYFLARMRMSRRDDGTVDYHLRRLPHGPRFTCAYRAGAHVGPATPGTREFFLLERYLLFVERGPLRLCGPIHHAPLETHRAELLTLEDELSSWAGLTGPELSSVVVHYVPRVGVDFFPFHRVTAVAPDLEAQVPVGAWSVAQRGQH
ncbi:MAG: DUF2071 domain-containing protein [Myxococcota bacterium]